MKKIIIIFLIMMLTRITSFSQITSNNINQDSTVSIAFDQLKYTNLIFIEHEKLLIENGLLSKQVSNQESKIHLMNITDSLRINQIDTYKALNDQYTFKIEDLNQIIKDKNKTINLIKIGGITVSCGLLILLLIK